MLAGKFEWYKTALSILGAQRAGVPIASEAAPSIDCCPGDDGCFSPSAVQRDASRPVMRRVLVGLCVAAAVSSVSGCKQKSAEKCDEAKTTVQKAVEAQDWASAKQWREYAYKQCEDTGALAALDQSIVDAEKKAAEKKAADEAEAAKAQQFVSLFSKFVADNREAPDQASKNPDCGEDKPGKSKDRWCKSTRQVGDKFTFQVRYWEADPKVARFTTKPPKAMTCEEFGASKVLGTQAVAGGKAKRYLCEITGGPLSGLQAVVTDAQGSEAHVFSKEYVEVDSNLRKYAGLPPKAEK